MSQILQPETVRLLREQLTLARKQTEAVKAQNAKAPTIQIPGVGKTISSAYEQLRKAAENTEEHLLLQRAIRRFFNRSLVFSRRGRLDDIGEELIVELTQAGYLPNNTVSSRTATAISKSVKAHVAMYHNLRKAKVSRDQATEWTLDLLSVDLEEKLEPHHYMAAIAYIAYRHFLELLPRTKLIHNADEASKYEICLYMATHQVLLKSDKANLRHDLVSMYQQTPEDLTAFVVFNRGVDKLYNARLTHKLKRTVNKYGALMRILKSLADERDDIPELLADRDTFLAAYDHQVAKEYRNAGRRLNRGIIKSIVFIFITKVIVGIGIEIPYDLLFVGSVAMLPLVINLVLPPLYMASLKLGLKTPSLANAEALHTYIDKALFEEKLPPKSAIRVTPRRIAAPIKLLYSVLFFIPFAITVYALSLLHFNVVQGVIFFVFLSTASFLGFRLSRIIRDIELVTKPPNFLATMRDFFYLPFVLLGQWISGKYAKLNIVAYILDIVIELPLKTVLRLARQWTSFLSEKHDEIY